MGFSRLTNYFSWSRSLSIKMLAIFVLAAVALLLLLWLAMGMKFRYTFGGGIQSFFTSHLVNLQAQVGSPPDLDIAKQITQENLGISIEVDAPGYRWSSNGKFILEDDLTIELQRIGESGMLFEAGFYHESFVLRTFNHGYITSYIIAEPLAPSPQQSEVWTVLTIAVLIFSALFWGVSRVFRPVHTIEQGIRRIGSGDVNYRITVNRQDELGSLTTSINDMADSIEEMLVAKRHLLLAISHEMRTPITRAKLALSLLEDDEGKASVMEDLVEMEEMVEELLESERLQGNHTPLLLKRTNLNEVIYQVQGRFFAEAPLLLWLDDSIPDLLIDAGRMSLAIKNVIKNALTSSRSIDSKVIVTTHADDWRVLVCVSDSGEGIAAKDLPRLTEPFYRPDRSRQRKTGGSGIGLYLIKAVMDAHNGELHIDSGLNLGTTVTLILPVKPSLNKNH